MYTMPNRKAIAYPGLAYLGLNPGACAHRGVNVRVDGSIPQHTSPRSSLAVTWFCPSGNSSLI